MGTHSQPEIANEAMRQYYALVFADGNEEQGERPDYPVYRSGRGSGRSDESEPALGGEEQPEYTVYRSRRGLRKLSLPTLETFRARLRRRSGAPGSFPPTGYPNMTPGC